MTEARNGPDKEAWITLLAEVGRYALDRWTVEDKTVGRTTAKTKAVNNLSRRDFDTLAAEAREALNTSKERYARALTSEAANEISNEIIARINKNKRFGVSEFFKWHTVEIWKGVLAFLGLLLFATAIRHISPAATKATQDGLDVAVGSQGAAITQPSNSISAPATVVKPAVSNTN
jgi:hypothetical protein